MRVPSGYETKDELERLWRSARSASGLLLSRAALEAFLTRFVDGELSPDDMVAIGDVLECEHVAREPGFEAVMGTILFEISSPEINGRLDARRTRELIAMLRSSQPSQGPQS